MLVKSAHAARSHDGGVSVDDQAVAGRVLSDYAAADAPPRPVKALDDVGHAGVLHDACVGQLAHAGQEVRGDLLAGDVLVVDDARTRVGALAGVVQLARGRARKADAALDEVVDDGAARADHHVHALQAVLVVARAQRVLEERLVVVRVVQHADAALRQHGVAAGHVLLGEKDHVEGPGQVESAVQARHAAPGDDDIAVDGLGCHVDGRFLSVGSRAGREG